MINLEVIKNYLLPNLDNYNYYGINRSIINKNSIYENMIFSNLSYRKYTNANIIELCYNGDLFGIKWCYVFEKNNVFDRIFIDTSTILRNPPPKKSCGYYAGHIKRLLEVSIIFNHIHISKWIMKKIKYVQENNSISREILIFHTFEYAVMYNKLNFFRMLFNGKYFKNNSKKRMVSIFHGIGWTYLGNLNMNINISIIMNKNINKNTVNEWNEIITSEEYNEDRMMLLKMIIDKFNSYSIDDQKDIIQNEIEYIIALPTKPNILDVLKYIYNNNDLLKNIFEVNILNMINCATKRKEIEIETVKWLYEIHEIRDGLIYKRYIPYLDNTIIQNCLYTISDVSRYMLYKYSAGPFFNEPVSETEIKCKTEMINWLLIDKKINLELINSFSMNGIIMGSIVYENIKLLNFMINKKVNYMTKLLLFIVNNEYYLNKFIRNNVKNNILSVLNNSNLNISNNTLSIFINGYDNLIKLLIKANVLNELNDFSFIEKTILLFVFIFCGYYVSNLIVLGINFMNIQHISDIYPRNISYY